MAKKIIFVVNSLLSEEVEFCFIDFIEALYKTGRYRPVVVSLRLSEPYGRRLEACGIQIYERIYLREDILGAVRRLVSIIRKESCISVVSFGRADEVFLISMLASVITSCRLFVWFSTYPTEKGSEFLFPYRLLQPFVKRFIAFSSSHKKALGMIEKIPMGKIDIILPAAKSSYIGSHRWREKARATLGIADDSIFAVAMIAPLTMDNRFDIFIEAARKVVKRRKDVHFFIIGDGPNLGNVKRWAQESELLGYYLSILKFRDDLPEIIAGFNLLCVCSEKRIAFNTAALYAMLEGVAVLTSRSGCMGDFIEDGRTGFVYHPLTVEALAGKILELMDSGEDLVCVAEEARRKAQEIFRMDRMVEEFERVINRQLALCYKDSYIFFVRRPVADRGD